MKYAAETSVSSEKSQAEIRSTLNRYGATKFAYFEEDCRAAILFEVQNRRLRFILPLPDRTSEEFVYTRHQPTHNRRLLSVEQQHERWEQACRQRWRALALAVKAKLEAVETGIATFEEEFLAHIVMPDGKTIGECIVPQIPAMYETGLPPLLPAIGETAN